MSHWPGSTSCERVWVTRAAVRDLRRQPETRRDAYAPRRCEPIPKRCTYPSAGVVRRDRRRGAQRPEERPSHGRGIACGGGRRSRTDGNGAALEERRDGAHWDRGRDGAGGQRADPRGDDMAGGGVSAIRPGTRPAGTQADQVSVRGDRHGKIRRNGIGVRRRPLCVVCGGTGQQQPERGGQIVVGRDRFHEPEDERGKFVSRRRAATARRRKRYAGEFAAGAPGLLRKPRAALGTAGPRQGEVRRG